MKIPFAATLLTACLTLNAWAETTNTPANGGIFSPSRAEVENEIDVTRWSLNRSSMASVIPKSVVDNSNKLLDRAARELAEGNLRTARELNQRAAAQLVAMAPAAQLGRHPDPREHKQSLRDTVMSLLPEAQRIAREKSMPVAFIERARQQVAASDRLLARGELVQARQVLEAVYRDLTAQVAALRSGDSFYLAVPDLPPGAQWDDGLRRIEERRFISQYLLIEAESGGLDVGALQTGLQAAEKTVSDAQQMAAEQRWQPALRQLDLAYALYEESWRKAGVDW